MMKVLSKTISDRNNHFKSIILKGQPLKKHSKHHDESNLKVDLLEPLQVQALALSQKPALSNNLVSEIIENLNLIQLNKLLLDKNRRCLNMKNEQEVKKILIKIMSIRAFSVIVKQLDKVLKDRYTKNQFL